jgi:hypothetical protein
MILLGYTAYCVQEGMNPFSIENYQLQQIHVQEFPGLAFSAHDTFDTLREYSGDRLTDKTRLLGTDTNTSFIVHFIDGD